MILQDADAILAAVLGLGIGLIILILVIAIAISALLLLIGLKVVGGEYSSFGQIMGTTILMTIVQIIPCIGCILAWYFVKSRHTPNSWGKALLAILISMVLPYLLIGLIVLPFMGVGLFSF